MRAWDREYRSLDWSSFDKFRDYLTFDSGLPDVSRVVVEDGSIVALGWLQLGSTSTLDLQSNFAFDLPGSAYAEPLLRWLDEFRWAPSFRCLDRILEPGVGLAPEHTAMYRSLGYSPYCTFVEMHRDIAPPLPELAPTEARIVPWTLGMHELLLPLYNGVFRSNDPINDEQWDRTEIPGQDFDGAFSHVAYRGEAIAGFVLALLEKETDEWIDPVIAGYGHARLVVIGDGHEGHGVEAALISACVRSFRASGIERMCVQADDEEDVAIYGSLGFAARREFVAWRKEVGGASWR